MTLKSKHPLSADDRRYLKANAQVLSLLEDCRGEMHEEAEQPQPSKVVYSAAEWLAGRSRVNASTRESLTEFHRHLRLAPALPFLA